MQLGFDMQGFLAQLADRQREGVLDICLSSAGKSHIRSIGGIKECESPSRFALGHLVDTIGGPGTAEKLVKLYQEGDADVETFALSGHLASIAVAANAHFVVVIRLVSQTLTGEPTARSDAAAPVPAA